MDATPDNPRYSVMAAAWISVDKRATQLAILRERMRAAEDALVSLKPEERSTGHVVVESVDEWYRAFDVFALEAEACLMFAAAALNTLAEAIAETWEVPRDSAWSFASLRKHTKQHPQSLLAPFLPRMNALHLRVVVPRNVLAAHPPLARGGSFAGMTTPVAFESWIYIDELIDADVEAERLRRELSSLAKMPSPLDRAGLLRWVFENTEALADTELADVEKYIRRFGCRVVPIEAIDETSQALVGLAAQVRPAL